MGFFSKLGDSTDLVTGLSERLGVDLRDPMLRNPGQAAFEYRSMVLRCSACTDQVDCAERQARSDRLDAAPEYCMNKEVFDQQR